MFYIYFGISFTVIKNQLRPVLSLVLDHSLFVVRAAAGALVVVAWEGVSLEPFDAVDMEEMGAGEQIDWLVPEIHETDGALIVLALYAFCLDYLPIDFDLFWFWFSGDTEPF